MDFSFDEGQQEVREFARGVLARCTAAAAQTVRPADGGEPDEAHWSALAGADFLAIGLPEKWGGSGGGTVETALLCEQVGRSGLALPYESAVAAAATVARFGTDAQRHALLPQVVAGEARLSHPALAPGDELPTAEDDGGRWLLRGEVRHVPAAQAVLVLLPVRLGDRGGTTALALVDSRAAGVTAERFEATDSSPEAHLRLDQVRVESTDLYAVDDGDAAWEWLRQRSVAASCAVQLGTCAAALEMAARHCLERQQFGQPLGRFQAVAQRLADAYIDLQLMEVSTWRLVTLLTADDDTDRTAATALAKHLSAQHARRVMRAAVHLHGGLGVDVTYPLAGLVTASKRLELRLGGEGHHLAVLADLIGAADDLDGLLLT